MKRVQSAADLFAPPVSSKFNAREITNDELKALGMSDLEIVNFLNLRSRYLAKEAFNFEELTVPLEDELILYDHLSEVTHEEAKALLEKLVVVKLNGGRNRLRLGATKGAQSTIELRKDKNFLDFAINQVEYLYKKYGVTVPFVLMNSFESDAETKQALEKYAHSRVQIHTFVQQRFPIMYRDTLDPLPGPKSKDSGWYSPGHGDVYSGLYHSGLLEKFIKEGKETVFISSINNLAASPNIKILKALRASKLEFFLEVTDRIHTDNSGGLLVSHQGRLKLMEMSQVPFNKEDIFRPVQFRYWNTNNIWVDLAAVAEKVTKNELLLDFVVRTTQSGGRTLVQLEMPCGMAIHNFKSRAILVPRGRYAPLRTTSELLKLQSDLFVFDEAGVLVMNPLRKPGTYPTIKLGDHFDSMLQYEKRFRSIPNILELAHLTVSGDVTFGSGVTLKGTVIIVTNFGERIDIPDGTVLDNKIVTGTMVILEH